jgi:hypothetical protein
MIGAGVARRHHRRDHGRLCGHGYGYGHASVALPVNSGPRSVLFRRSDLGRYWRRAGGQPRRSLAADASPVVAAAGLVRGCAAVQGFVALICARAKRAFACRSKYA